MSWRDESAPPRIVRASRRPNTYWRIFALLRVWRQQGLLRRESAKRAGTQELPAGVTMRTREDRLGYSRGYPTESAIEQLGDWPKVQQLHRALSDAMKKESLEVANFGPSPAEPDIWQVIDELTRVVLGTMDECRLASSKDRQLKGIQARASTTSPSC